jgi:hypothetical protein
MPASLHAGMKVATKTPENRKRIVGGNHTLFPAELHVDNTLNHSHQVATVEYCERLSRNSWTPVSTAATLTTCTIDGVAVPGLENPTNTIYNVVSVPFSYTTAEKDNIVAVSEGEPCLPGGLTVYPAVADGVYLMLSPLSPGKHKIHFVGEAGPGGSDLKIDITYDITVSRECAGGIR